MFYFYRIPVKQLLKILNISKVDLNINKKVESILKFFSTTNNTSTYDEDNYKNIDDEKT